jgi:carboxypeptidase A2
MTAFGFVCFILLIASTQGQKKRYDGSQLIQVYIENDSQADIVQQLSAELDVWREARAEIDILVPRGKVAHLVAALSKGGIKYEVKVPDIQRVIDEEEAVLSKRRASGTRAFDYNDFNTLEDINAELLDVVARCPAGLTCETVVHGQTSLGRSITGIRIRRLDRAQRKVWIDATIHAREWLATATHMKIVSHIVDDYHTDEALRQLVDTYDWYLLPVVNPDGYSFTWTNDRLWRKNRTPNTGSTCFGTDLNRNFADTVWGTSGASSNPCAETHYGSGPGSELETQAMQAAWNELGASLLMTVNLHTYGQMWLTSHAWTYPGSTQCYIGPDQNDLITVANAAADAVQGTHNTVWTRGPFCLVLYAGSGTSVDYGHDISGIKYTFLPELRGTNFVISNTQIIPSFQETWNGIKAAIVAIELQNSM